MDYLRGHKIELKDGEYVFSDTQESTVDTWKKRPCGHCGKYNTPEGHDACLGTLRNVINACCGHGIEAEAYVQYENGREIRGEDVFRIYVEESGNIDPLLIAQLKPTSRAKILTTYVPERDIHVPPSKDEFINL